MNSKPNLISVRTTQIKKRKEVMNVSFVPPTFEATHLLFYYDLDETLSERLTRHTHYRKRLAPSEWHYFDKYMREVFVLYFGENMI